MVSRQIRTEKGYGWVLTASDNNAGPERDQMWMIVQNQTGIAKRNGYPNMHDLIKNVLKLENIDRNQDFHISIFNIVSIKEVNFGKLKV